MPNPWVYFDLEGTGPDAYHDRIVEMCFVERGSIEPTLSTRVNPGRPIPAEVTEVHGISTADVAGLPPFSEWAAQVQELVDGRVLVGYNLIRYDTILIDRELRMAGQPGLQRDRHGKICQPEVDLYGIWQRMEPRRLATAAKRFGGTDLENAHSADADTVVLPAILEGQLAEWGLDASIEKLAELSRPEGFIDRDGKFVRREDGVVVLNFSKNRGQPVHADPSFLEWMLGKDFSPETPAYARIFLEEIHAMHADLSYPQDDLPF